MSIVRKSKGAVFKKTESYTPSDVKEKRLIEAFLCVKDKKLMAAFLRDLLAPAEIAEFANRFEIARLLKEGKSYKEIADQTGVSTTTVTRVSHWLYNGCGGYFTLLYKKHLELK